MGRVDLPNGYLKNGGTVLNDCSTYSDWIHAGTGDSSLISVDTENVKHGTSSISFKQTSLSQTGYRFETIQSVSWDMSKAKCVYVSCFVPYTSQTPATVGTINLYLSNDTNLASNRVYAAFPSGIVGPGWNLVQFPRSVFIAAGGSFNWANPVQSARLEVHCNGSKLQQIVFDAIIVGRNSRATVLLTFDDCLDGAYARAFAYTNPRNIRMTHFIIPAALDTAGYCTQAEVEQMHTAGDLIGLHDSASWDGSSQQRIVKRIGEMNALGFGDGVRFASWPGGAFGQNSSSIQRTLQAAADAGIVACRCADADGTVFHPYNANQNLLTLPICMSLDSGTSVATALATINEVLADGGTMIIMAHDIEAAAGANTWATADFQSLIDRLALYRSNGLLDVLTMQEWYDGLSGARIDETTGRLVA